MTIESYIRAAPKAELHVHLEGAIQPETLLLLARRNKVDLPADTVAGLRHWFAFRDFPHFIEVYIAMARAVQTAEDFELVVWEFARELARQNVHYVEATFTPTLHRRWGIPFETYFAGLSAGRRRASKELGVEVNWVFDIVRDALAAGDAASPEYTVGTAIAGKSDGVVALGFAGSERDEPVEWFLPWFERGRAAGLHVTAHAGEVAGALNVARALDQVGAERIDHGVRAVEDPVLVARLAAGRVPLNVCPTSNLRLGVVPDLAAHPLPALRAAGIPLTINSDDPPLFNTTLNDEVVLLATTFGLDLSAIDEILLDGIRASFLPEDRKRTVEDGFVKDMARLRQEHL